MSVLYLPIVGGVLLLILIVATMVAIIVSVVYCKRGNRQGRYDFHDHRTESLSRPVTESPSRPIAENTTKESTFSEEGPLEINSRTVDVDGVNEPPLGSVSHKYHNNNIIYEVVHTMNKSLVLRTADSF